MRPLLLLSAVVALFHLCIGPASAALRPPNVIFIIADDLGYGDLGCYGQQRIRTPHLDRIAAEGMRFTQHYSGNAVCAPSRCVLMTGKHPGHAFIRDNRSIQPEGQFPIPADSVTVAKLFQQRGYATGGFGKWGLGGPGTAGEPLKQGFTRWFGYNCQGVAHNFYPTYLWDNDRKLPLKNPGFPSADRLKPNEDPADPKSYARFKGTEYSSDLIWEQARRFVRDGRDKPFFLFAPTTVPHLALQVPEDSLAEYANAFDDLPYAGGKGYLPHFKPRAAYAAMITRMDKEVGALMKLVAELGLDENTIWIFTSDNGPLHGRHEGLAGTDATFFNSSGGLRDGKGTLFEGGFRVPGIVRWKGKIAPGQTSDRVTGFEDWMPTLMELTGAPGTAPKDTDGISFAPTLLGQRQDARTFLYREFPGYGGQQSVRIGDWKGLRQNLKPGPAGKKAPDFTIQLFNLRDDPAETTNVAAKFPDIVNKMADVMRAQHVASAEFPLPALDKR
jgi:arylsulfatase A